MGVLKQKYHNLLGSIWGSPVFGETPIYFIGLEIGCGIWPQFCGSFAP